MLDVASRQRRCHLLSLCVPLPLQVSPMDVTKTRLQVMVQGLKGPKPSLVTVMSDIVKNEGIKGLYAGCVGVAAGLRVTRWR